MRLKSPLFSAAAALAVLSAAAPAAAGGGHGYGHGYDKHGDWGHHGSWRYDGYHGAWHPHYGHHYRYKRHRGGLSGAEAGLIAAGIVGAAILIDSASDRRGYDDRDDERYDRYGDRRSGPYDIYDGYDGYDRTSRDGFYYRRDDRGYAGDDGDDPLDRDLAGGRAAPGEYNYGAAYNDCKAEAREAARREGLSVGLPARPEDIRSLDGGAAVRFVTRFEMQDRGRTTRQTMVCEADGDGVRFLELV
ncbi:MAG: hypothetical protein HXY23_04300 [Parvularculaceae bacterium]|nr:hypothetical protein [Parvularculaceae bacterium]